MLTCGPSRGGTPKSTQGARWPSATQSKGAGLELNSPKQPSAPWEINNEYVFCVIVTRKSQF